MKHKIFFCLSIITLLLGFYLLAYVSFSVFYPYDVLDIKKIDMITPQVKVGGIVTYDLHYCKNYDIQGTSHRQLINHFVYAYPEITVIRDKGCGVTRVSLLVPDYADAGSYQIRTIVNYKINAIRTVNETFVTPQFEIIK